MRVIWCVPFLVRRFTQSAMADTFRYQDCEGAFALRERGGGWKLPQIWIQRDGSDPELSDAVFISSMARLALVVIVKEDEEVDSEGIADMIGKSALPAGILTNESITLLQLDKGKAARPEEKASQQKYFPCTREDLLAQGINPVNGYDETTVRKRIGKRAKYVILRPDFYIHSIARDEKEFLENVQEVSRYFQ